MTLIEAFKSGKNFKRPRFYYWVEKKESCLNYSFREEDILADDWEIESPIKEEFMEKIHNLIHPCDAQVDRALKRKFEEIYNDGFEAGKKWNSKNS